MKRQLLTLQFLAIGIMLFAQPVPGDLFKEYHWNNTTGDCNGALRVGGRLDYKLTKNADHYLGDGRIETQFEVDLTHAVKAELVIEKMLCHGETEGLRISVNGHQPIRLPEAENIPKPQSNYAHHFNAIVPVNLGDLKAGTGNTISFEVDTAGHWWPQNLVYGMILRVYFKTDILNSRAKISSPADGDQLGNETPVTFDFPENQSVEKINIIGYYDDADLEGDGIYTKWHYAYHKCNIYNHIGTVSSAPYSFKWNTEWLPNQDDKISLAAFVHTSDGYIYMTEAVKNLKLNRTDYSIELCKPYQIPKGWFTRNDVFKEKIQIMGELEQAVEAKMVFRTWSPGYFNGIYINDFIVFMKEGPKYDYYEHDIPVEALYSLRAGENIIKTGKTQLYPEGMVHGVEMQWPGIMLLIKYKTSSSQ